MAKLCITYNNVKIMALSTSTLILAKASASRTCAGQLEIPQDDYLFTRALIHINFVLGPIRLALEIQHSYVETEILQTSMCTCTDWSRFTVYSTHHENMPI